MTVKTAQKSVLKWPKDNRKGCYKWGQNDTKTTENDAKTMPKWSLNNPKVTPDRPKNGTKSPKNGPVLVTKGQKMALHMPGGVKNGSKRVRKMVKSSRKNLQKSTRPSSKCIKILRIHSGHFQAHLLIAHFHKVKRRFWPFFYSKTRVL